MGRLRRHSAHRRRRCQCADFEVHAAAPGEDFRRVLDVEIEHRAGDHLFDLAQAVIADRVKFVVVSRAPHGALRAPAHRLLTNAASTARDARGG